MSHDQQEQRGRLPSSNLSAEVRPRVATFLQGGAVRMLGVVGLRLIF